MKAPGTPCFRDEPARGAATVIQGQIDGDQIVYEIQYAEGGTGWWPESALAFDPE